MTPRTRYAVGTSAILDAAYSYIESSPQWPILPLAPRRKRPYIRTGRDHAECASTDPDVIRAWLARWPDMELGTPTGWPSGTVVIDVDPPDGERLLAELERDDVLGPLPRVRVSRSPRGGVHIYCARPDTPTRIRSGAGARSPLGRLLGGRPGVDVRADGGLVVLPPSRGRVWLADDDGPLPPLPPRWLAAIVGAGDPPLPPRKPVAVSGDRTDRVRRARAYLASLPPAIAGQGGHAALWRATVAVVRGFAVDDDTALALLAEYSERCEPPWTERELAHKIRDAQRSWVPLGYLLDEEVRHG